MMNLDATTPTTTCPHCGHPRCDIHCPETDDGRHLIDGQSVRLGDFHDLRNDSHAVVVSVACRRCGQSGDVELSEDQIGWDGP